MGEIHILYLVSCIQSHIPFRFYVRSLSIYVIILTSIFSLVFLFSKYVKNRDFHFSPFSFIRMLAIYIVVVNFFTSHTWITIAVETCIYLFINQTWRFRGIRKLFSIGLWIPSPTLATIPPLKKRNTSAMKQQRCYIKNPTKPKGKTNKRLQTCPISTISCITTTRKEVDASAILVSD